MSATLASRPYQVECGQHFWQRVECGDTRIPSVMATGLGKTHVFTAELIVKWIAENPSKRALIIAHTDELINQAFKKMRQTAPHIAVGIVKAQRNDVHAQVIVTSRQTLASAKRRDQIRNVGFIILDECFPAGTLVGGKPIESLKPGDLVPSWDEESGREVMAPVVALTRRTPSSMVRVVLDSGETIECTPSHPILTTEGWCPAGSLWSGALVVSFTHDATSQLHQLRHVRGPEDAAVLPDGCVPQERPRVVPGRVSRCVGETGHLGANGAHEQGARVGSHEGEQPDGTRGFAREDEGDAGRDRSPATRAGRERQADPRAPAAPSRPSRVAGGVDRGTGRRGASLSLQAGHRPSPDEGVRGGGRGVPLLAGAPRRRPAPGRTTVTSRVVDVQVLEPGSDGTYGGVCPDGAVYNIEVAGTHTYLIGDGVVVHNCHHATRTNTYGQILEHFGAFREVCAECVEANEQTSADVGYDVRGGYCPNDGCATGDNRPLVAGFTATLVRSDKAKLAEVWQPGPVFSRDIAFGIRHGYLLDVKGKRVVVPDMDMRNVKQAAGDFSESGLADELERSLAPQVVAEAFAEVADGRKGIGFAPTVDSAYAFAEAFSAVGVKTEVVHGKLGTIERAGIIARLADGATQFVWSVMALTEGFDDPTVDIAVIARATRHAGLYQQMVGRVLRPNLTVPHADRTPGLVLDVVGVAGKHHLASLIDLDLPDDPYPDGGPLEEDELADIENFDDEPAGEGGGFEEVRELYLGPIEVHDFDPLARDNAHAWGRTEGGIYFLTAGEHAKVFLVPDATPNEYSLAWVTNKTSTYAYLNCPGFGRLFASRPVCGCGGQHPGERGGWANGHRGLSMESALAWGVDVAQELGGEAAEMFGARKKAWRKIKDVTGSQKWMLHKSGGTYVEGMTKGEVSDEIDRLEATSRIDPVVAALQAMAISEKEMAGAG